MNFKKILSAIGLFSLAVPATLSVTACGQTALDGNLDIIKDGETKFNINELIGKELNPTPIKENKFKLDQNESSNLVKSIAETILKKSDPEIKINWWNDETPANTQKCYNFVIRNGKEKDGITTWDIDDSTNQRFSINIRFWVGSTDSEGKFKAFQQIDKTFHIKVANSVSDSIVDIWIKKFNEQDWDTNPIEINLSNSEIKLPEVGKTWSDLSKELITKTKDAVDTAINKFVSDSGINPVIGWNIQSIKDKKITDDYKLELQVSVTKDDAKGTTNSFYIKFVK